MYPFLLHNDDILDSASSCLRPGQVGTMSGWGVFSTIRVFDGVLFSYERHLARMRRDARLMHVPFPEDPDYLRGRLLRLIEANAAPNATVRVIVIRNKGGIWEGPGNERDFDVVGFMAPVNHWGKAAKLGLIPQARHAANMFAGAKIMSWAHNLTWYEDAHKRGLDEVVLLNERGEVSECTSANIFAAMGDEVWTPPINSGCLPGVTRELLLEAIHIPGVQVIEKTLMPADLEAADEVFITSTTRNLIPVAEIEGLSVRRDDRIRGKLDEAFSKYVDAYVSDHLPRRAL